MSTGLQRHVARALGRGDDERVGTVDRHVHVEEAQRPADHPRREVVVHRERVAERGGRIARRVGTVVDRDVAERLTRRVVLVQVAARPGRVADGAADAVGPEAVTGTATEAHAPERVVGGRAREHRAAVDGVVCEHDVGRTRVDGVHRVGDRGDERDAGSVPVRKVRDAERRLDVLRVRAHEPVDVVGADPCVAGSPSTHASSASDAGVTSPLSRRKPVVAALAKAIWSLPGFASPITLRSQAGTRGMAGRRVRSR